MGFPHFVPFCRMQSGNHVVPEGCMDVDAKKAPCDTCPGFPFRSSRQPSASSRGFRKARSVTPCPPGASRYHGSRFRMMLSLAFWTLSPITILRSVFFVRS